MLRELFLIPIIGMSVVTLATADASAQEKSAAAKAGTQKIGNVTVTQGRRTRPNQPPAYIEVTCNGGSTTITCPDGMTSGCAAVIAQFCSK